MHTKTYQVLISLRLSKKILVIRLHTANSTFLYWLLPVVANLAELYQTTKTAIKWGGVFYIFISKSYGL